MLKGYNAVGSLWLKPYYDNSPSLLLPHPGHNSHLTCDNNDALPVTGKLHLIEHPLWDCE